MTRALEIIARELDLTMAFCGHTDIREVGRDIPSPEAIRDSREQRMEGKGREERKPRGSTAARQTGSGGGTPAQDDAAVALRVEQPLVGTVEAFQQVGPVALVFAGQSGNAGLAGLLRGRAWMMRWMRVFSRS